MGHSAQAERPPLSARRAALSVVLLAGVVFVGLALVTFDPHDPPDPDMPVNPVATNACGRVGAWLAKGFLFDLGASAYLLIVLGGFWTWVLICRRPAGRAVRTVGAIGATLLGTSALLALLAQTGPFRWLSTPHIPSPGGFIGAYLSGWLVELLAFPGTLLFLLTAVVVALILATDMLLLQVLAAAGRKGVALWGWLKARWKERRKAASLTRALSSAKARARTSSDGEKRAGANSSAVSRAAAELGMVFGAKEPAPAAQPWAEPEEAEEARTKAPAPPPAARLKPSAAVPTKAEAPGPAPAAPGAVTYQLPGADLLDEPEEVDMSTEEEVVQEKARVLERCLAEFGVTVEVVGTRTGPVITQYELSLAPGTKVGKVLALRDDIAMALKSTSVRIEAPLAGRGTVGVEVPNVQKNLVRLKDLMDAVDVTRMQIPLLLGRDVSGHPVVSDLTDMPHLLIAGCTGSGKSVCINSIIMSILLTRSPRQLRFLLVDPKMVELSAFRDLPHLLAGVVTEMKKAASILSWAERSMDERYELLAAAAVRNISAFNELTEAEVRRRLRIDDPELRAEDIPYPLPYIVIVIDELADLMMLNRTGEVETSITRLAQKSRAVGIHIIFATQRPSVDVVTGLIKANLPARISFQVSSKVDSRTILDQNGAEKLLGRGDMLYLPPQTAKLVRAQGTYVSDEEVRRVVEFVSRQARPQFSRELTELPEAEGGSTGGPNSSHDDLYDDAVRIVVATGRGSVSLLQRRLEIGYSRAARLVDMMAESGIVGEYKEGKARDVLVTDEEWNARQGAREPVAERTS
jgi:S-DNA-T family DNA segregation ATPase FtsK/SpoIIIE